MAKKYEIPETEPQMVSEPTMVCRTTTKPHVMVESLAPCSFTDEEFKEELLLSETSGFVSDEEFKRSCLEKWGVAL